jgi:hypothetical protein
MIEDWNEFLIWWYEQGKQSEISMAEAAEVYFNQEVYMETI